MTDSFEQRIMLAQQERSKAIADRDRYYPGTPEWEQENATVEWWDAMIRNLKDGRE